jgi:hypothetical protein
VWDENVDDVAVAEEANGFPPFPASPPPKGSAKGLLVEVCVEERLSDDHGFMRLTTGLNPAPPPLEPALPSSVRAGDPIDVELEVEEEEKVSTVELKGLWEGDLANSLSVVDSLTCLPADVAAFVVEVTELFEACGCKGEGPLTPPPVLRGVEDNFRNVIPVSLGAFGWGKSTKESIVRLIPAWKTKVLV